MKDELGNCGILFRVLADAQDRYVSRVIPYHFADDNTRSSFAKTVSDLIKTLEEESRAAINWFSMNDMIANPDKFKAIILDKQNSDFSNTKISVNNENLEIVPSVKLLRIQIDSQLNFNMHINNICKSAANQLNALIRLNCFLGIDEKKVLVNSFVLSNFNYYPLVWFISSTRSWKKIENLQKRALRFLLNDYESSYEKLLEKSDKSTINLQSHRSLCFEVFKTIYDLNPSFMNDLFQLGESNRPVREKYRLNLNVPKTNQVRFGTKSLRNLAPKIWNSLPPNIKSVDNLNSFKALIKNWDGTSCNCIICAK